jgi:hypothetical protein
MSRVSRTEPRHELQHERWMQGREQTHVESGLLLDVVVRKGSAVLELLAGL